MLVGTDKRSEAVFDSVSRTNVRGEHRRTKRRLLTVKEPSLTEIEEEDEMAPLQSRGPWLSATAEDVP
jgi:hypothetical protein